MSKIDKQGASKMQIAGTNPSAFTDGPGGRRFSIYVQGCSIHCPGCQVRHLWDKSGGVYIDTGVLAKIAIQSGLPVSILGGEPFDQAIPLSHLLTRLKAANVQVIVYSGYTLEQLQERARQEPHVALALQNIDILVDGPFVRELDHDRLQYRGSTNQRVIDMRQTHETGELTLIDWDTSEIVITDSGDILGAKGLIEDVFGELGESRPARRCGQVDKAYEDQRAQERSR